MINLFHDLSEPIRLSSRQHEYHVIPDVRRQSAMEIYSIDSVVADDPQQGRSREFQPFYSFHHFDSGGEDSTFWYSSRRPSQKPEDPGSEVFITLVDLGLIRMCRRQTFSPSIRPAQIAISRQGFLSVEPKETWKPKGRCRYRGYTV